MIENIKTWEKIIYLYFLVHFLCLVYIYDQSEATNQFLPLRVLTVTILLVFADLVLLLYFLKNFQWLCLLILMLLLPLSFVAIFVAQKIKIRAFNDCVENAESVRVEILNYRKNFGEYPSLKKNFPIDFCGRLILNGSILRYELKDNDFELYFTDGVVFFRGSSTQVMVAGK